MRNNKLTDHEQAFIRSTEADARDIRRGDNIAGVLDVLALAMVVGAIVAIMMLRCWMLHANLFSSRSNDSKNGVMSRTITSWKLCS